MHYIDKTPLDKDGKQHGEWIMYHRNGKLWYRGNFIHGFRHGFCEGYNWYNNLDYRGNFNMDKKIGYWNWHTQKRYHLCLI